MAYKQFILIVSLFLFTLMPLSAQQGNSKKQFDIEKFKKEKAEFLSKEIGLTDMEAKAFIPLVNELIDKKFQLNKSIRGETKSLRSKKERTDADYKKMIEASYDLRTKELELDKEYYIKFQKVLPAEKIYKYQRAETKFMRNMVGNYKSRSNSAKK